MLRIKVKPSVLADDYFFKFKVLKLHEFDRNDARCLILSINQSNNRCRDAKDCVKELDGTKICGARLELGFPAVYRSYRKPMYPFQFGLPDPD